MRWYSLKKYLPPTNKEVLIRALNISPENKTYERYFLASLDNLDDHHELIEWEFLRPINNDIVDPFYIVDFIVTHFCILEPIEIEESTNVLLGMS